MIRIIDHAGVVLIHTIDRAGREAWYTTQRHPVPPSGSPTTDILIDVNDNVPRYTQEALRERDIEIVGSRAARPQRYAPEYMSRKTTKAQS